jgi:hypothetical protein
MNELQADSLFMFKKAYFDSITDLSKYKYEAIAKNKDSFWESIFEWLASFFPNSVNAGDIQTVFYYLLYLSFICIAFFIILKAYNVKLNQLFTNKADLIIKDTFSEISDINSVNFTELIERMRKEKNYFLLIRYLFLDLLKNLDTIKWIKWNKEKTNYEFKREMINHDLSSEFNQIVYYYEYIWYGDHQMAEDQYLKIVNYFDKFCEKINGK